MQKIKTLNHYNVHTLNVMKSTPVNVLVYHVLEIEGELFLDYFGYGATTLNTRKPGLG